MPPDFSELDARGPCPSCGGAGRVASGERQPPRGLVFVGAPPVLERRCPRCGGRGEVTLYPHGGPIVREAVAVAAQNASKARDEALADRMGRSVIRELVTFLNTKRAPRGEDE